LLGVFIAATIAGTWAAYSYAAAIASAAAAADDADDALLQTSNFVAKTDRLAAPVPAADTQDIAAIPATAPDTTASAPTSYAVAALASMPAEPLKPRIEPRAESRKPAAPEKQKRAEQQKLLLDDAQIASLRTRLKLTPTQEEFWPAVEVTLRDVVRTHARKSRKAPRGVAQIDVNSPEVQQLISAAVPLIMRLSEEQKREVRALARVIGLETVAAKI
jgi:hypothetical protein